MYLSVDEFLLKNETLTKELPEFPGTFSEQRNVISQIKLIDEQQKNVRTGVTKDKWDIKSSLITLAAENSGKIFAFAKVSDNKALMDEVNFSISDLGRMTDVGLRTYAEALYKKADTILESLTKYGISGETQKMFAETLAAYNNSMTKPRVGIAEKSEATKELVVLFSTADSLISKLDAIIGIIRYKEVKFYNGYKTVRKIVNTNSRQVSLKGTANDLKTREPLKGVMFTFKSNGTTINKKTADKGSFLIRNMNKGTYDVVVKKEGYKEKIVTVSINECERSELKVELELV
jgi:hypothetical protein